MSKAVFLDYGTMGPDLDLSSVEALVDELVLYDTTTAAELAGRIAGAELAFTNKIRFTDEILAAAPGLRYIGLTATGADNIDLEGARRHGITVCNIRAYCTASVVEHVFGSLLMLTHRLKQYTDYTAAGHWQAATRFSPLNWPITELRGKTLGIVGYGELGRAVADVGRAFGMEVLVAARRDAATPGEGRVAFTDMLERSDVVSLHCPLSDKTRRMIGAGELARMKAGAILVNTARGGLVDSGALAEALENERLGGACIDVLPSEPPRDGDPLLDYSGDRLLVTPHIAWASREARQAAIEQLADNARAFLAGTPKNTLG